jgi:hypothetical protein
MVVIHWPEQRIEWLTKRMDIGLGKLDFDQPEWSCGEGHGSGSKSGFNDLIAVHRQAFFDAQRSVAGGPSE